MSGPCAPWIDADDLDCGDAADRPALAAQASSLLYRLTGSRWPGVCTDTVRPFAAAEACCHPVRWSVRERGNPAFYARSFCGRCVPWLADLGHGDVLSVTSVRVDGTLLAPSAYAVLDWRWLVRRDGGSWPVCPRLDLPATEAGTFEVALTFGATPPAGAVEAARALACELDKAANDEECQLPARVTSVVRQGVSFELLDPTALLERGRTGIYAVDVFLAAAAAASASWTAALAPWTAGPPRRVTWEAP